MHRLIRRTFHALLVGTLLTTSVACATSEDKLPHLLVVGAGAEINHDQNDAALGRVLFRASQVLTYVRPHIGVDVSVEGAFFLYVGGGVDIPLGIGSLYLTPTFGGGYYYEGGGTDLGYQWEFRTGTELTWQFEGGSRLGLSHHHVSNNGYGGNANPGQERVMIVYSIPLD